MNEQLTELLQYVGHLIGGGVAFALVRFTSLGRFFAMIIGAGLAMGIWFLSPAVFLGRWPSPDDAWFGPALFVHSAMAMTLAAMGAFLFRRNL